MRLFQWSSVYSMQTDECLAERCSASRNLTISSIRRRRRRRRRNEISIAPTTRKLAAGA